jgi:antitoxin (DNA-binding transcriptional repressor) of toxin-antitoxin stability system
MYNLYMTRQVALAEARRTLPALIRQAALGGSIEITSHDRVVARLVAPVHDAAGAAEALLRLRQRQARRGRNGGSNGKPARIDVSTRKNDYLSGRAR